MHPHLLNFGLACSDVKILFQAVTLASLSFPSFLSLSPTGGPSGRQPDMNNLESTKVTINVESGLAKKTNESLLFATCYK